MALEYLIGLGISGLMLTALVHSIGGEIFLLRPMFKHRGNRVLDHSLARMVLRFAWHITSVFWLVLAVILYVLAFSNQHLDTAILFTVGGTFAAVDVFDLFASRGRHIGWPLLLAIGVCVLGASFLR